MSEQSQSTPHERTSPLREIGAVMGVAVLASLFSAEGGYASPEAFTDGLLAALPIAVVVLAIGTALALLLPGRPRADRVPAPRAAAAAEPAQAG